VGFTKRKKRINCHFLTFFFLRKIACSLFLIFIISLLLCCTESIASIKASALAGNIAFLKNNDVWIINRYKKNPWQITNTGGKVEDFLFSSTLRYLVYSKVIGLVDEPGIFEEEGQVPKRAVCSLVIVDLIKEKIVKQILPPESSWIYPSCWLPGEKLLFYASSGFEVWGFFEYNIQQRTEKEINYTAASVLLGADFSQDNLFMAYVGDYSKMEKEFWMNLHLVDLQSGYDKVLLSKKSILYPTISHDQKNIAFLEVTSLKGQYFDNLWVSNINNGSSVKLYAGPARAKTGELAWSFDDRSIGMFFSPEAGIVEIQTPEIFHRLSGADFNWSENKKVIFSQGNNIYFYDLNTKKRQIFLENASKPKFLREGANENY